MSCGAVACAVPAQNEMNGASGPSDIEGKAARVAASKPGGARVSISSSSAEDSGHYSPFPGFLDSRLDTCWLSFRCLANAMSLTS